ncbi:MAG: hypothetical protein GY835_28485 [bacterium]|nr:hypothetical protein [bacterium]
MPHPGEETRRGRRGGVLPLLLALLPAAGSRAQSRVATTLPTLKIVTTEKGAVDNEDHRPADPHSLADDRIYALLGGSARRLWIGTYGCPCS